jgi:hypothetical protein
LQVLIHFQFPPFNVIADDIQTIKACPVPAGYRVGLRNRKKHQTTTFKIAIWCF